MSQSPASSVRPMARAAASTSPSTLEASRRISLANAERNARGMGFIARAQWVSSGNAGAAMPVDGGARVPDIKGVPPQSLPFDS